MKGVVLIISCVVSNVGYISRIRNSSRQDVIYAGSVEMITKEDIEKVFDSEGRLKYRMSGLHRNKLCKWKDKDCCFYYGFNKCKKTIVDVCPHAK